MVADSELEQAAKLSCAAFAKGSARIHGSEITSDADNLERPVCSRRNSP